MKKLMTNMLRYAAAGMLTAVCAVAMIGVLAHYQEPVAVLPGLVAMASFMGAQMMLDTTNHKNKKENGTEEVLPCGDGAE